LSREKGSKGVDLETSQLNTEKGNPQLKAVWTDPDFEQAQEAYYYVRVLQPVVFISQNYT
jgi:hypothetical protein